MSTLESRIYEVAEQHVDDHAQTANELADAIEGAVRPFVDALRKDLQAFKPQPMSLNCRDGHHNGATGEPCSNCWCLCHRQDAEVARLHGLVNELTSVADGFVARVDDLTGQVAGRDATIQRVRDRHAEHKIYTECGHQHEESDPGVVEVDLIGPVCEAGYEYSICRECCVEGGEQTEVCATYHDHRFRPLCPTRRDIDGDPADDGSRTNG